MTAEKHSLARTREKQTAIDAALPPIAVLAIGKPTVLRYVDLDGVAQTLDYRDLIDRDPWPIPMPIDREGYGSVDTSHQFWATGYGDWLNVRAAVQRYAVESKAGRLFDFGCASGRFLRHVLTFSELEPIGCDFAPANVDWVKRHLPDRVQVVLNSVEPKLPFPDNHFDVVTAFSVFTHIDSGDEQWLLELRRIVRPDGLLYVTIQNQAAWDKVIDRPGSLEHMRNANNVAGNLHVGEELFKRPMPSDRIVFRMSNANIYNCNVWLTDEYVRKHWSRHFGILQIAANAHTGFQSVVIMRSIH